MKKLRILALAALASFPLALQAFDLSKHNVVWDSPSQDSLDSMPL
jgi:hypothetical protein